MWRFKLSLLLSLAAFVLAEDLELEDRASYAQAQAIAQASANGYQGGLVPYPPLPPAPYPPLPPFPPIPNPCCQPQPAPYPPLPPAPYPIPPYPPGPVYL